MTVDSQQELEKLFKPHTHPESTVEHGLIQECEQAHNNCSKTIKTPAGYLLECLCHCGHGFGFGKELI